MKKKPTLVPVLTKRKKSRKNFHFYKKKAESKNSVQHLLFSEPLWRQCHDTSWGLLLGSRYKATMDLNCVCEHLCFISVNFVCPFVRCVLRYERSLKKGCKEITLSIKLDTIKCFDFGEWKTNKLMVITYLLYAIWHMKSFIGIFYFWIVGETYTWYQYLPHIFYR